MRDLNKSGIRTVRFAAFLGVAASLWILGCHRDEPLGDSGKDAPPVFATRSPLEVDTVASMWLIQRFVFPEARFHIVPHGVPLTNGIPFDTPEAEFRRYATLCCFESILRRHPVNRPGMEKLAAIVHDIEINHWGPPRHPEVTELKRALSEI